MISRQGNNNDHRPMHPQLSAGAIVQCARAEAEATVMRGGSRWWHAGSPKTTLRYSGVCGARGTAGATLEKYERYTVALGGGTCTLHRADLAD